MAPILGFFDVFIWVVVIGQVMQNLDNIICYIAYAGGFAAGTVAGMWWEECLAVGFLVVRIITMLDDSHIKERFAQAGIGVTTIDAEGISGKVKIVFGELVKNIKWPSRCLLISVIRAGGELIPDGQTMLMAGDYIHVLTSERKAAEVKKAIMVMAGHDVLSG